jgi:hypothetical protein
MPPWTLCVPTTRLQYQHNGVRRLIVLETKGIHRGGNDDITYKQKLLDLLSDYHVKSIFTPCP